MTLKEGSLEAVMDGDGIAVPGPGWRPRRGQRAVAAAIWVCRSLRSATEVTVVDRTGAVTVAAGRGDPRGGRFRLVPGRLPGRSRDVHQAWSASSRSTSPSCGAARAGRRGRIATRGRRERLHRCRDPAGQLRRPDRRQRVFDILIGAVNALLGMSVVGRTRRHRQHHDPVDLRAPARAGHGPRARHDLTAGGDA